MTATRYRSVREKLERALPATKHGILDDLDLVVYGLAAQLASEWSAATVAGTPTRGPIDSPALLSIGLAANYLGLGEQTIREQLRSGSWSGPMPRRIGSRWMFSRSELDRWLIG